MNHDHIRRVARDSELQQREAMPEFGRALTRFLDRESRTEEETSAVVLGGLTRRSLFRIGGVTIAGAALLAACGSDSNSATTTLPGTSPTTVPGTTGSTMPGTDTTMMTTSDDIVWLRTASSLENLAVAAYQLGIDSGLVTTGAVVDAAKLFQGHHQEHSQFFQAATKNLGGDPYTEANAVVLASLQPTIDALKDEQGVLMLALALERAAAATYQSGVGNLMDLTLNKALMSVGGVEARHAAVLAGVLAESPVPRSFGTTEGAVAVGTGV